MESFKTQNQQRRISSASSKNSRGNVGNNSPEKILIQPLLKNFLQIPKSTVNIFQQTGSKEIISGRDFEKKRGEKSGGKKKGKKKGSQKPKCFSIIFENPAQNSKTGQNRKMMRPNFEEIHSNFNLLESNQTQTQKTNPFHEKIVPHEGGNLKISTNFLRPGIFFVQRIFEEGAKMSINFEK
eukprot:Sdes_comp8964_c0_seq1m382